MAWTQEQSTILNSLYNTFATDGGANVGFKLGTQADLNKLLPGSGDTKSGTAAEGTFYLTSDTHRLYIGRKRTSDSKVYPVAVNEGITPVASENNLPNTANVGEFYYIENGNILAICSQVYYEGTTRKCKWIQVNSATHLTNNDQNISIGEKTNGAVTSHISVKDAGGYESKGDLIFKEGNNITLTSDEDHTLTIAAQDTTYTMSTTTNGYHNNHDTTTASDKVASINLSDGINTQTVKLVPGTNVKGFDANGTNGEIKVDVIDTQISGVTVDTGNAASTSTNGFNITVETATSSKSGDFDPVITIGSGATSDIHFVNGKAVLDVYTATQAKNYIDGEVATLRKNFNAMTYKGTVSSSTALGAVTNASIGDTYKADSAFKLGTIDVKVGDLIIAYGTGEDANGKINAGGKWEVVPSGDDQTITGEVITGTNGPHGFSISDASGILGGMDLQASTAISLSAVADTTDAKLLHVTVAHANVTRTDGTATAVTQNAQTTTTQATTNVTLVSGVTTNAQGHVTGVTTQQITLVDSHNKIEENTITPTKDSNGNIVFTQSIVDADGGSSSASFTIKKSSSIDLSVDANSKMVMEVVWGTF